MDVVIPLSSGSYWDDKETMYALRSLEKNFKDLGQVYIVGHKPKWIANINHIECEDEQTENKGKNIIKKLLYACNSPQISNSFLFVSDDQLMLKPMEAKQIKPYYVYDLKNFAFSGNNRFWMQCLKNAKEVLEKEGLYCFNYEPHCPMIIRKEKFRKAMDKYDWRHTFFPTLSLYFNQRKKHEQLPDNYRVFYANELHDLSLMDKCYFAGYDDMALSVKFQNKLQEMFPTKSKYEV